MTQLYIVISKDGRTVVRNAARGLTGWNLVFGSQRDVAQPMLRSRATAVLRSLGSAYKIELVRSW